MKKNTFTHFLELASTDGIYYQNVLENLLPLKKIKLDSSDKNINKYLNNKYDRFDYLFEPNERKRCV